MALTPGCADTNAETTPEVQVSSPTLAALSAFSQQGAAGASLKLADVTPFAWDTVWFFMDGSATGDIESRVGLPLFSAHQERIDYGGPLLIFMKAGAVVEVAAVVPPLFLSISGRSKGKFSADAARVWLPDAPPGPRPLSLRE